jgi:hypothetical protein
MRTLWRDNGAAGCMMPDIWGRTVLFESRWFDFLGTLGSGLMGCLKSGEEGRNGLSPNQHFLGLCFLTVNYQKRYSWGYFGGI